MCARLVTIQANVDTAPVAEHLFDEIMDSLCNFHTSSMPGKSLISRYFVAPQHLREYYNKLTTAGFSASDNGYEDNKYTRELSDSAKERSDEVVKSTENGTQAAADKLKSNGEVDDFDQLMDAQEDDTIKRTTAVIKKQYADGKKLGHEIPAQQKNILGVTKVIASFWCTATEALGAFVKAIGDCLTKVYEAVKNIISGVVDKVTGFFKGAVSTVSTFFGNLF